MKAAAKPVAGQKPSKNAEAMLAAKLRRVNALSARDRMKLALQLGLQLRRLEADRGQ